MLKIRQIGTRKTDCIEHHVKEIEIIGSNRVMISFIEHIPEKLTNMSLEAYDEAGHTVLKMIGISKASRISGNTYSIVCSEVHNDLDKYCVKTSYGAYISKL